MAGVVGGLVALSLQVSEMGHGIKVPLPLPSKASLVQGRPEWLLLPTLLSDMFPKAQDRTFCPQKKHSPCLEGLAPDIDRCAQWDVARTGVSLGKMLHVCEGVGRGSWGGVGPLGAEAWSNAGKVDTQMLGKDPGPEGDGCLGGTGDKVGLCLGVNQGHGGGPSSLPEMGS